MTPNPNLKDIIEGKTATELDAIVGFEPTAEVSGVCKRDVL